jgi:two-component system, NarL family, nitrate/nitrite response regulator NarL
MNVLIVDDHVMFREALRLAMGRAFPDFDLAEAGTAEDALAYLSAGHRPGLILLDLKMPGLGGLGMLKQIKDLSPETICIVVSDSDARSDIRAAVRAGALGYILKRSSMDVLERAITMVLAGERYIQLPAEFLEGEDDGDDEAALPRRGSDPLEGLTVRQQEVLNLLSQGRSNKEIAKSLGLLEGTVKVHVRDILRKLGVSNRTQAAMLAARAQGAPPE